MLSDQDIKKKRQNLIKQLTKKLPSSLIPSPPAPSPPKNATLRPSPLPQQAKITDQDDRELGKIDVEQLLSDIIAVVESKLPAGDDLVTDLCEAIHGVFVEHGLINAEE